MKTEALLNKHSDKLKEARPSKTLLHTLGDVKIGEKHSKCWLTCLERTPRETKRCGGTCGYRHANTLRKAKAEILLITLSDVQSKTMVDTLAHTVAEHTMGSVKIEKLINSFANKLLHVAAAKLGDTLTYVQVEAVLDTLPHTREM